MSEHSVVQLLGLKGRVALVTGGAGYLGTAMAQALAEAGATVVISSRNATRAGEAAARLPGDDDVTHCGVALDYKDEASIELGFRSAVEACGHIDIVVNNGHGGMAESINNATAAGFRDQMSNLSGYFALSRLVHDHAVERSRPASVVLVGSMYGVVGSYPDAYKDVCEPSPVAYHALKGGIVHMTRYLSVYWAHDQVRVNCLSPGPFPNPATVPTGLVPNLKQKSPMGRVGQPHELKGALLLLCSDAGSYITGQNIIVDGGWTAW